MPYIHPEDRESIDAALETLFNVLDDRGQDKGEYVYAAYCIAKRWLSGTGDVTPTQGAHYVTRSSAVSILADAHHYFRKDYLDMYEDLKKHENGAI